MNLHEKMRMHILMDADAVDSPPLSPAEREEMARLQEQYDQEREARNKGPWKPFT